MLLILAYHGWTAVLCLFHGYELNYWKVVHLENVAVENVQENSQSHGLGA